MSELMNMTSFNEKGAESILQRMHLLATDIDTMLQCKLLSMSPPSACTAVAGTEYTTEEQLAAALDEAMEKEIVSVASLSTTTSEATSDDATIAAIRQARHKISKNHSRNETTKQQAQRPITCFYHDRFGYKARKCTGPPCKFAGLLKEENYMASH